MNSSTPKMFFSVNNDPKYIISIACFTADVYSLHVVLTFSGECKFLLR